MSPDKALELVLRYASLGKEIKKMKSEIGRHLMFCKGVSGKRQESMDEVSAVNSKGKELDLHLTQWYTPIRDTGYSYSFLDIGEDQEQECRHCFDAHLVIQRRKAARKQIAAVKAAMSRARPA